ncbi:hypothetical protein [Pseudomonas sp. PDM14]|nr:hypothetical protein [Pseudomonas sp. PDM14]
MPLFDRADHLMITDLFGDYACPALCSVSPPVDPPSGRTPPPPAH